MTRVLLFLGLAAVPLIRAQSLAPQPDDRFKADVLLIVAHPDDEGMAIGYLAKAVLDQHKRVAIVYGTRGDGGENAVGLEKSAALGAEREIEARKAVGSIGITNVWFLGAPDTPGQNVLRSLEAWNHGSALWQVVRLIRLTRPQVVMTWLPAFSVGENHGDHQAAAVLATEAFDMAADPTAFPEQIMEGVGTWQAQKLYFFSDTANPSALDGKGPQYPWDEMSPSKNVTYGRLALESIANHRTQDYPGLLAERALKANDFGPLKQMKTRLVLGKSLVNGSVTGDVFEGTVNSSIEFKRVRGYEPELSSGVSAELGDPWAFYQKFYKAHDLPGVREIFPPQMKAAISSEANIPILIHNSSGDAVSVDVNVDAPREWGSPKGAGPYPLRPHESRTLQISFPIPAQGVGTSQKVRVQVVGANRTIADLAVDVTIVAKD